MNKEIKKKQNIDKSVMPFSFEFLPFSRRVFYHPNICFPISFHFILLLTYLILHWSFLYISFISFAQFILFFLSRTYAHVCVFGMYARMHVPCMENVKPRYPPRLNFEEYSDIIVAQTGNMAPEKTVINSKF